MAASMNEINFSLDPHLNRCKSLLINGFNFGWFSRAVMVKRAIAISILHFEHGIVPQDGS